MSARPPARRSGRRARSPAELVRRHPDLPKFLLFVLAFVVAGELTLAMRFPTGEVVAYSWSAGVAAAAIALAPRRLWPVYVPALFLLTAVLRLIAGTPALASATFALANVVAATTFAALVTRIPAASRWMRTRSAVLRFVAATTVAALAGGVVVAVGLDVAGATPLPVWQTLLVRTCADLTGILSVSPAIMLGRDLWRTSWRQALWLTGGILLLIAATLAAFTETEATKLILPYLPMAVLLLAVVLAGWRAAAILPLLLVPLSVWFTAQGSGVFAEQGGLIAGVVVVQLYNTVTVVVAWLVAAVVTERQVALRDLDHRIRRRTAALRASRRQLHRQLDRLAVIAEFSRISPGSGPTAEDVLETAAVGLVGTLGGACAILLPDPAEGRFRAVARSDTNLEARAAAEQIERENPPPMRVGPAAEAYRSGATAILDGAELAAAMGRFPAPLRRYVRDFDIDGIAFLPLRHGGRRLGVIALTRYRGHARYSRDDLIFVLEVAERAALVVENIRLTSEAERSAAAVAASEERFRLAFDQAPVAAGLASLEPGDAGRWLRVNAALAELTGHPADRLLDLSLTELAAPQDAAASAALVADLADRPSGRASIEVQWVSASGAGMTVRISASAVRTQGKPSYMIAHVEDVTGQRLAEEQLAHRALYDSVTGLPNRHVGMDHLRLALDALARSADLVAVLYVDVDRFKEVNDTYGHHAGDLVLHHIGRWLTTMVRAPDTAARLGGDEFVVVVRVADEAAAETIAERIQRTLSTNAIPLSGASLRVTASIGLAVTDVAMPPEEMIRRADLAMYAAKRRGRHRWERYTEEMGYRNTRRITMLDELARALDEERFRLHYQPIFDLASGRIVAAEALLRLDHSERGVLLPAHFIDVAEDSDLVIPIAEWVLTEACRQVARWQEEGISTQVAINVSGTEAALLSTAETLLPKAEEVGIDPARLNLEVTERAVIDVSSRTVAQLRRLTERGVGIAVDDFGTGFSSLSHLKQFPVTALKIDRSFVDGLPGDPNDSAIVEAVTAMGQTLGLTVIAEGVETAEQVIALLALRCHQGQGFRLARPGPPERLAAMLSAPRLRAVR